MPQRTGFLSLMLTASLRFYILRTQLCNMSNTPGFKHNDPHFGQVVSVSMKPLPDFEERSPCSKQVVICQFPSSCM